MSFLLANIFYVPVMNREDKEKHRNKRISLNSFIPTEFGNESDIFSFSSNEFIEHKKIIAMRYSALVSVAIIS